MCPFSHILLDFWLCYHIVTEKKKKFKLDMVCNTVIPKGAAKISFSK